MTYRGITGNSLHVMQGSLIGTARQGTFYSTMLITERYFQVQHMFSVTLKAKMSGFNYAGMYGTDGDFMYLFAGNLEEVHYGWSSVIFALTTPGILTCKVCRMKANRLKPGVPLGDDRPLLGYFAFKQMGLRALRGERRILIRDIRRQYGKTSGVVIGQDGKKAQVIAVGGGGKKGCYSHSRFDRVDDRIPELIDLQHWNVFDINSLTIMQRN
jgi:hypothetical protein